MAIAFDNEKYIRIQSEHIRERIAQFGNKLYLELGGKLFDDLHASRVLPGFMPDSKLQMLTQSSETRCARTWALRMMRMCFVCAKSLPVADLWCLR